MSAKSFHFVWLVCLCAASARADVFLDLTSVTPGTVGIGTFTGTLGSVTVTGSIGTPGGPPVFSFNATGAGISDSTTDDTSPQFSYASIYTPSFTGDRVGWSYLGGTTNIVSIAFSAPVVDPVFHVANLDVAQLSFALTGGLTSLTLLSGNGGGGDGISPAAIAANQIADAMGATADATSPASTPPTTGDRSAYASVRLNGTISTITIGVGALGPGADLGGGSFSISAVPETSSFVLVGLTAAAAAAFALRKR
jgi:hypothetical protein